MGNSNKVCPNCGRKMKQQFQGLQHCKCGVSWLREMGFFERTTNMRFCLERRKTGKKTKQCSVIRFSDEPGAPVGKPGKNLCMDDGSFEDNGEFALIAGYTSDGSPYGITRDELGIETDCREWNADELPF